MEHLKSRVSVLTKLNVRFEGELAVISSKQCCIQLNKIVFKGLENRKPPETMQVTKDPADLESLRFFKPQIQTITLLNDQQSDITSEIIKLIDAENENEEIKTNDDEMKSDCLFSIGLIADPQYADHLSRFNHPKNRIRRYRNSLKITKNAIKTWNECDKPLLVVCCGDIIDGINKKTKKSTEALEEILDEFGKFKSSNPSDLIKNVQSHQLSEHSVIKQHRKMSQFPFFINLIGNHELYNFDFDGLGKYFYSPSKRFYFSYCPFDGFIFIVLNCYEVSLMSPNKEMAKKLLAEHNGENVYGIPHSVDDNRRWVAFGGAFGSAQLQWLESELQKIEGLKQKHNVILFGHQPIWAIFSDQKSGLLGNERTLCWDYREINKIIGKYECVKMYISGHRHDGEIVKDPNGIWHRTLEGAVESDGDGCFGTMFFYETHAVLKGYGIKSGVFSFR